MLELRTEDLLGATAWYRAGSRIGPVTGFTDADRRLLVALSPPVVEAAPPLPPGAEEVDRGFEDVLYAHYAAALLAGGDVAPDTGGPRAVAGGGVGSGPIGSTRP